MYGQAPYGGVPYGSLGESISVSATAPGVVLTVTASTIAGAATGTASAAGGVSVVAASLLSGAAEADAAADGAVLTVAASLDAGGATITEDATAPGALSSPSDHCTVAVSLLPGVASVKNRRLGGGWGAPVLRRDANTPGALLVVNVWIDAGEAEGENNFADDELFLLLEAA